MAFMENGKVPHGKVALFVTEDEKVFILQAGEDFCVPPGNSTGMILGLNEEVTLPFGSRKKLKNMGGFAMCDGVVPAQLFPELG